MTHTFDSIKDITFPVHRQNLQDFNCMVHAARVGFHLSHADRPLRVDLAYSISPPKFFGYPGTEAQLINA